MNAVILGGPAANSGVVQNEHCEPFGRSLENSRTCLQELSSQPGAMDLSKEFLPEQLPQDLSKGCGCYKNINWPDTGRRPHFR